MIDISGLDNAHFKAIVDKICLRPMIIRWKIQQIMRMRMSVRRIPRNYRFPTGIRMVPGSGRIEFEGTLERDFYLLKQFDPDFLKVEAQPLRIEYVLADRNHIYHPDALVHYQASSGRRPELCEIKSHAELRDKWHEFRPRFKAAARLAHSRGWVFRIYTEHRIRGPRLDNLRIFRSHLQQLAVDQIKTARLRTTVREQVNPTFTSVINSCAPGLKRLEWLPLLWAALATNKIGVDIDAPIVGASPLWLPESEP